MGTQILRPTAVKRQKGNWLLKGTWGRRSVDPMSKVELYDVLHCELISSGVLPSDSPSPSIRHHDHVTMAVMQCSWIEGRWVQDETVANRLKRLREKSEQTQEQLAHVAGLDVGTIRQLEQGTRTNPTWQTICALARGLDKNVVVFLGTEGWVPDLTAERCTSFES